MTGAFLYLTWCSLRNRVTHQIHRSRNPRYALALIIGVAYFYFIFWRNPRHVGSDASFPLISESGHLIALSGLFLGAVSMWLLGGDSTALAFTQAEASMLFPAPVSRRQLVAYKLMRGQLPLLFNTAIWVMLLGAGHEALPLWARAVGLWALFAVIFLHRLGASLVRTAWAQHGLQGLRKNALSLVVFVAILVGVGVNVLPAIAPLRRAANLDAAVSLLGATLAAAPARYVLWPFTALLGPVFATSVAAWFAAVPGVLVVLAAHVWWVMRTDTAFEEAALAATAARAQRLEALRSRRRPGGAASAAKRRRAHQGTGAMRNPGLFALAPVGRPAVAIVWKNLACLRRTTQQRQLITPMLLAVIAGAASGSKLGAYGAVVTAGLVFAFAMLLLGPMMLRGDLRQDLLHLSELKTLPLRGTTIVAAEVLSVSIPLAVIQAVGLVIAAVAAQTGGFYWGSPVMRAAFVLGLVPLLLAFNAASVTVQNGAPILFPGWARLGTTVPGGVEMMGQMILLTGFYILLLALLLVLPGGAAFVVLATLHLTGPAAVLFTMVGASAALAFELRGVLHWLGRAFERMEPSSVSG